MRRAAKRDASEPDIVETLEGIGCDVTKLSDTDLPDLLVGYRGKLHLMEVKTGNAKLRPGQEEFRARMEECGVTVKVVRTPSQALDAIGFCWDPRKRVVEIE
jgi:hypothetical protein